MFPRILDGIRIIFTFINILTLFVIVPRTGISLQNLVFIVLIYFFLGIFVFRMIKKDWFLVFARFDYFGLLLPSIFNSFFLINYVFAGPIYEEQYSFEVLTAKDARPSPTIVLENAAYQDFYFFRTFTSGTFSVSNNRVTYQLADGLFGLKVMKHYDFSRDNVTFEKK